MRNNKHQMGEGSRTAAPAPSGKRTERTTISGNSPAINDPGHMNHFTRFQQFLLGLFVAIACLGQVQAQTASMGTYYAHPNTEVVVPTLLIVPCVGYGPGGYRLGYGGGFYDRTLAAIQPKPFTLGLGFAQGFLPELAPEPHDVPLDAVLNENGVVWPVSSY